MIRRLPELVLAAILLSALAAGCDSAPRSATPPSVQATTPPATNSTPTAATASVSATPSRTESNATPPIPPRPTAADYAIAQDYCASVGTVDEFDARYPGSVPSLLIPWHVWRCVDTALLECPWTPAGFIPCRKPDTSREPSGGYVANCAAQRNGDLPSFAFTQMSAYRWTCRDGRAVIVGEIALDTRGFFRDTWQVVPRGAVPPARVSP